MILVQYALYNKLPGARGCTMIKLANHGGRMCLLLLCCKDNEVVGGPDVRDHRTEYYCIK